MWKKIKLDEIKKLENEILIYFSTFCQAHGIRYYLSNGTLLGAIKYKGFIPWDDDVDVSMPRQDYEKFIEMFENDDRFTLYESRREKSYLYPFAKLSLNGTRLIEKGNDNGVPLGINIDIFPIDYAGSNYQKAKLHAIICRFFAKMLQYSKSETKIKKVSYKNILRKIGKRIGAKRWVSIIDKKALKYKEKTDSKYKACFVWPAYKAKEVVPSYIFADTITAEFEGRSYPVPAGYDVYLRSLYGNYSDDPPIEKQKTHHSFEVYYNVNVK